MKFCSHCGKEVMEKAVICPNCGCSIQDAEENSVNVGLVVLSILIPLAGIILAIVYAHKAPKASKAYLKAAIITIVVETLLWVLFYFVIFGTVFAFFRGLTDALLLIG